MILDRKLTFQGTIFSLAIGFLLLFSGCSDVKEAHESPKTTKPPKIKVLTKTAPQSRIVYTSSTADINRLLIEIDYSLEAWNSGEREIPRLYLTDISPRWQTQSEQIPIKAKKAIFFQLVIPLILHANELIEVEQKMLIALADGFGHLSVPQQQKLQALAKKYKVIKKVDEVLDKTALQELLERVNVIPPSLSLAQAAEESGWGTSRFAILGNSLFGQWAFSKDAMRPRQQRKELGDYGLARFDTPQDAVNSYMLNLNTHLAYKRLRQLRTRLSQEGKKVSGYELAKTLDKYSERGQAYVESLHAMMRINHLGEADDAYLWDKEIIYLTPVEDAG